ncbi:phenylalanine--tRNA ligase subunit beta [Campylobacter troglodytis]|uniref:phenylalanine--tRNA ligase subunit beta n=1 Tax=Campylobacter troglodytis TaxID=654363 RepID=UPI0011573F68|nr:phenylalanine--tRNA ligase subunit beta [Campylobacter troglodytis]TQR53328.1 phenylalanine--tRNA ligase subunit beta [Campylobacter troglodytis]
MIVTRTWLSEFIDLKDLSLSEITKKLNEIGIEVDNAHSLRVPDRVVVGQIKEKTRVENSDKLSLCEVDIGEKSLQVVCGAKNVEVGQFVALALEGANLPNGLKIQKTTLRGVVSEGMICSSTELGLAKINEGIMILDESIGELELGKALNEYAIFDDDLMELELTSNRGDCLSVYGIARELSAGFDRDLKKIANFEDEENNLAIGRIFRLSVDKELKSSYIYRVVEFEDVAVNLTMSLKLATISKLTDNTILNFLNCATHSMGAIFNAYDLRVFSKNYEEIIIKDKKDKKDKKLVPIEELSFVIKKGENQESLIYHKDELVAVSGIYQSPSSKVTNCSNLVLIEANYNDPSVIALAKNKYEKQDEDTVYRSFRGSEPQLNLAMNYLLTRLVKYADAQVWGSSQHFSYAPKQEDLKFDLFQLYEYLGVELDTNRIINILKRLGFGVTIIDKHLFNVKPPIYRSDIANFADLSEEIMRIVGIDNIPARPLIISERTRLNECYFDYRALRALRHKAVANGYFESVHYVLDSEDELKNLGFKIPKIKLINPISKELNTLRSTLINQLLNAASFNTKNSKKIIKLFTSGAVFDEEATQKEKIAFIFSGYKEEPKISNKAKPKFIDFYSFLLEMKNIFGEFSLASSNYSFLSEYEQARIIKNKLVVGFVGRVHLGIERDKGLQKTYVCELDLSLLKSEVKRVKPYSKFPQVSRDLSIIIPKSYEYESIKECIRSLNIGILKEFRVIDLYEDESLKGEYSLSINFIFQAEEKTLEDSQVAEKMEEIIRALSDNLGLRLRQ